MTEPVADRGQRLQRPGTLRRDESGRTVGNRDGRSPPPPSATRRIIVGDIHGQLDALIEILRHAGVIDGDHAWVAGNTILIQTGDVIDRGPDSLGAVTLLRTLQHQAVAHGSRVIRCCGNHELMLLQRDHSYVNFRDPHALADQLRRDIAEGLLQAAYTDGSRLYTHAGLRTTVQERLVQEIERANSPDDAQQRRAKHSRSDYGLEALADHINTVFRNAVAGDQCDGRHHCIFGIDRARGGHDPVGGIFWCDYTTIAASERAWRVAQVFGHSPSRRSGFNHTRGLKLINVDAGMCTNYGGHTVYLEITPAGEVVQHSKHVNAWTRQALEPS